MSAETKKIGVTIGTPVRAWHGVHPFTQMTPEQLRRIEESPYEFTIRVMEGGRNRARNKIVKSALEAGDEWILFWDDDVYPDDAADAVLRIIGHKRPLVAALYTTKSNEAEKCHWVATFMHEVQLQKGCLLQVIEAGAGFKLYHRKVFEELARLYPTIVYTDRDSGEKMFGFFQEPVLVTDLRPDGDLMSEDYFCDHICRHVKIGIFVDTELKLRHKGKDGTMYPAEWPPIPFNPS